MSVRIVQILRFRDGATRDLIADIARGMSDVRVEPVTADSGRILIVESRGQFRAHAIAQLARGLDDDARVMDVSEPDHRLVGSAASEEPQA